MFGERKRGSLTQYKAILTRTRRDPTFPEFTSVSKRLQQKLAARRGECLQRRPSGGGALDFAELRSQAGKVEPRFHVGLRALYDAKLHEVPARPNAVGSTARGRNAQR